MTEKDLAFAERLCIALSQALRKVFQFESPVDVLAHQRQEAFFQQELIRGLEFHNHFSERPIYYDKVVLELGCKYGGMQAALFQAGVKQAIGLDLDQEALAFGKKKIQQTNILLLRGDAESISLPSSSVDLVVSDAVFEHINDIELALREVFRVLRPRCRLYAKFSPTWLTYNGPHLIKCISIPWAHLFFSDNTLLNVLDYYKQQGLFPMSYIDEKICDFQRMGRLTRRKFRRAVRAAGLEIIQELSYSPYALKKQLSRLPLLDEFLAGQIIVILRKPSG